MHEVQVAGDACGGKSGSQDAQWALPVPPLGGQDVLALKGLEDPQQASLAREVCLMVYQDLAGGFRAEEIRSEEHTSELQSLMRISYAVFCLKKKTYFQLYDGDRAGQESGYYSTNTHTSELNARNRTY